MARSSKARCWIGVGLVWSVKTYFSLSAVVAWIGNKWRDRRAGFGSCEPAGRRRCGRLSAFAWRPRSAPPARRCWCAWRRRPRDRSRRRASERAWRACGARHDRRACTRARGRARAAPSSGRSGADGYRRSSRSGTRARHARGSCRRRPLRHRRAPSWADWCARRRCRPAPPRRRSTRPCGGTKACVGDDEFEVLGHLVAVDDDADLEGNLGLAAQRIAGTPNGGRDDGEISFRRVQQVLALACALAREIGVATDDEPFAGILGRRDGRHVALVEQRHLQRPGLDQQSNGRARKAVIQSSPAGTISASRRACVIIPRSPTSTTRPSAKRFLILSIWAASVRGSPVSPSNTSIASGQPSGAHSRP